MRYQNPTLQEKLATEYVMGSMTGQARRRFEKLLLQYPDIQAYVVAWSVRLQTLNVDIEPVTPPTSTWTQILANIEGGQIAPNRYQTPFWHKVALLAAVLLIVFGLSIFFGHDNIRHQVVVKNQQAQTEWIVEANSRSRRVMVQTITPPTLPANKVCVLWLIWKNGKVRPIGILPDKIGKTELPLPKALEDKPEMAKVVVSVETRGVNKQRPSSDIVFSGPWHRP